MALKILGIRCCELINKILCRRFIGIELDKTYFDIAKNRLQDYENDLTEVA